MNNIQKAFKTKAKRGLCMAVGGIAGTYDSGAPIAAPTIQGDASILQDGRPTAAAPQWSGGFKSMDHDPMADMNSLSPTNPASAPNPAYGGRFGNDPHFSASTSRVIQDRNLGEPRATGSGYIPAQRNAPAPNLMTPVDDLVPSRRGLQLANGGVVAETPEQVMARMAAKYGVSAAPAATPNPPVTPAPAPVAQPAQPSGGLFQGAVRTLRGRAAQIDKATGYAEGGMVVADGGRSRAPTADSVSVNLSHGEAVLPVKTVAALGGPAAVETLIETTNGKPTATRGLRAGGRYADGISGLPNNGNFIRPEPLETPEQLAQNWNKQPVTVGVPTTPPTAVEARAARRVVPAPATAPAEMAPPLEIPAGAPAAKPIEPTGFVDKAKNGIGRAYDSVKSYFGGAERATAPTESKMASPQKAPTRMQVSPAEAEKAAELSRKLNRIGHTGWETVGDTIEDIGRGVKSTGLSILKNPYVQGMGRAVELAAPVYAAAGNLQEPIRVKGDREIGSNAHVINTLANMEDAGLRAMDFLAAPITGALNFGHKMIGGDGNYFKGAAREFRKGLGTVDGITASTRQWDGTPATKTTPEAIEPGAQERTFSAGKPGAAAPAPTTAAGADTAPTNDIQRRTIRGANGQPQTEFYGKDVKQTYTGADGKPTTNWEDTKDYKEAIERNKSERRFLNDLTGWNIDREVASSNPAWRERGLARQKVFNEKLQRENERSQLEADRAYKQGDLEMRREDLGLRRAQEARALASAQRQMQRDAVEMDLKTREAMDKDEEQVRKIYAGHFLTKNDKGEMIEDKAALDDFLRRANHSILAEGRATKDARLWDANTNRPKSFANMDKATQDFILNRYNAYRRWKQAQGVLPGYADKGDTMNLFDLNAQEDGDYLVFPRLGKARAQKKDFMYTSPVGALDLAATKTPEDTLYRNLLGK